MKLVDRIIVPSDVLASKVGEEVVILDLASGTYFGLDPIGAEIWQHLVDGKTLAETCERMLVEYNVSREQLERDLLKLAQDLSTHGLIETASS